MGDSSIIARRISDKYVQYGFSGNGGYFRNVGLRLLIWYNERKSDEYPEYDDLIEYLFSLGETSLIGSPGSEKGGEKIMLSHHLCNSQFYLGESEQEIFSKMMFVDCAYFFDSDDKWYYIYPEYFNIKMPLELVYNNLDSKDQEFKFCKQVEKQLIQFILFDYIDENLNKIIEEYKKNSQTIFNEIRKAAYPIKYLYDKYQKIYNFFDSWVVVKTDPNSFRIENFIVRKKTDSHTETIFWE